MLTAIIHAKRSPEALAVTMSALVPAVADGLMSHAVVALQGDDPDGARIADAMGAALVTVRHDAWREAAATARGEWVLLLDAGDIPGQGWIPAIERHLIHEMASRRRAAFMPLSGGLQGLSERLGLMFGTVHPRAGLVGPRKAIAEGQSRFAPARLSVGRQRLDG